MIAVRKQKERHKTRRWQTLCGMALTLLLLCVSWGRCAGLAEAAEAETVLLDPLASRLARDGTSKYVDAVIREMVAVDEASGGYLRQGLALVFLVEGAGRNDDPAQRQFAYCAVVRLNEDGAPAIVYENDFCTTLPDHPKATYDSLDCATVMDGVYDLYTDNRNESGVLSIGLRGQVEVLRFNSKVTIRGNRGYLSDGTGIQIHMRKDAMNTGENTVKPYSRGCMMVGLGTREFNQFMNSVLDQHRFVTEPYPYFTNEVDRDLLAGRLIVNRTLAYDYLKENYGKIGALHVLGLYSEE